MQCIATTAPTGVWAKHDHSGPSITQGPADGAVGTVLPSSFSHFRSGGAEVGSSVPSAPAGQARTVLATGLPGSFPAPGDRTRASKPPSTTSVTKPADTCHPRCCQNGPFGCRRFRRRANTLFMVICR